MVAMGNDVASPQTTSDVVSPSPSSSSLSMMPAGGTTTPLKAVVAAATSLEIPNDNNGLILRGCRGIALPPATSTRLIPGWWPDGEEEASDDWKR